MTNESNRKILIAVAGVSPAILTETVWALAHEEPRWVPDQVVAITTCTGKAVLEKQLLHGGGWDQLRAALKKKGCPVEGALAFGASDSIRVIGDGTRDFDDIATPEESGVAADFLLGVLRQYTEQPLAVDVELQENVLVVTVPSQNGKPYSSGGKFYFRDGASSQQMTRDEIRNFFFKEGLIRFDEMPCDRFDLQKDLTSSIY